MVSTRAGGGLAEGTGDLGLEVAPLVARASASPAVASVRVATNFSGHETFAFRYTWLKKGVDAFAADAEVFRSERAIVTLGVGKNMVSSIRYWAETMPGSRVKALSVSRFGRRMFQGEDAWDSFLEDDASLWVLHWNLATNFARATTWYWAFNLLREPEFTRDSLAEALGRQVASRGWGKASGSTLKNDVSCFLRTYTAGRRGAHSTAEDTLDCPLASLGLLVTAEASKGRFWFNNKLKPTLPLAVFCFALLEFWDGRHGAQKMLSLREIVHGEAGAPFLCWRTIVGSPV